MIISSNLFLMLNNSIDNLVKSKYNNIKEIIMKNKMKDILNDMIAHTSKLGFLNIVRVTGTEEKTSFDSVSELKEVIMFAETSEPYQEMLGVFGMPQLEKLNYLLSCNEYREDAVISITNDDQNKPTGIHFENKDGDFKNDYKFMNSDIINQKLKQFKFRGAKWDVEITPGLNSIQRFHAQAGANTEYTSFLVKSDGNNLKFTFGDMNSHGGEFVFATNVTGKLTSSWPLPVSIVSSILKAADVNNTVMSFSNDGLLEITLDSGLAVYKYFIPAVT